MTKTLSMWLRNKIHTKPEKVEYIVVQPIDRVTNDAIQDELVDKVKDLLLDGYKLISASGSHDGSVHYILIK